MGILELFGSRFFLTHARRNQVWPANGCAYKRLFPRVPLLPRTYFQGPFAGLQELELGFKWKNQLERTGTTERSGCPSTHGPHQVLHSTPSPTGRNQFPRTGTVGSSIRTRTHPPCCYSTTRCRSPDASGIDQMPRVHIITSAKLAKPRHTHRRETVRITRTETGLELSPTFRAIADVKSRRGPP